MKLSGKAYRALYIGSIFTLIVLTLVLFPRLLVPGLYALSESFSLLLCIAIIVTVTSCLSVLLRPLCSLAAAAVILPCAGFRAVQFRIPFFCFVRGSDGRFHRAPSRRFRLFSYAYMPPETFSHPAAVLLTSSRLLADAVLLPFSLIAAILLRCYPIPLACCIFLLHDFLVSFISALIPMRVDGVPNYAEIARELSCEPALQTIYWNCRRTVALQVMGYSNTEMPDEWFALPNPELLSHRLAFLQAMRCAGRMIAMRQYDACAGLLDGLLCLPEKAEDLIPDALLLRLLCALMRGEDPENYLSPGLDQYMETFKHLDEVLLTRYALALLYERDDTAAAQLRTAICQKMDRSPAPQNIEPYLSAIDERSRLLRETALPT